MRRLPQVLIAAIIFSLATAVASEGRAADKTVGAAETAKALAAASWVVDWVVNRDKADPGPPNPLLPAPTETH